MQVGRNELTHISTFAFDIIQYITVLPISGVDPSTLNLNPEPEMYSNLDGL